MAHRGGGARVRPAAAAAGIHAEVGARAVAAAEAEPLDVLQVSGVVPQDEEQVVHIARAPRLRPAARARPRAISIQTERCTLPTPERRPIPELLLAAT